LGPASRFSFLGTYKKRGHILIRALSRSNSSLNVFSSRSLFLTILARLLTDEYDKPNTSPISRLEKRPVYHRKYTIKSLSVLSASHILKDSRNTSGLHPKTTDSLPMSFSGS
jgi:hypothetical protein